MKNVSGKKDLQKFAQQTISKAQQKQLKGGNDIVIIQDPMNRFI